MRKVANSGKIYAEDDKQAILNLINSNEELTFGITYIDFEDCLAKYVGTSDAFFVNSGSSADLLAVSIFTSPEMYPKWRLHEGDEIITLAASFPTTVFPIVQNRCVPVFIDITIPNYNADVSQLEKAYSSKTKGVIFAHTLGNPFDIDTVQEFCTKHDLFLIVDGCDALGSTYKGKSALNYGQVSTLSMYAAHDIFTLQGGALFTNDPLIAKLIRSFRSWGRHCICHPGQDNACGHRFDMQIGELPFGYDHKNTFSNFGYNLMATNVQAALGLSQMNKIDVFTNARHNNFNHLFNHLQAHNGKDVLLPIVTEGGHPAWFGFPLLLPPNCRQRFTTYIESQGVQTRYLFAGNIVRQPCFCNNPEVKYRVIGDLKNTDYVMENLVWVGCWHGLTLEDIEYEAAVIKEGFKVMYGEN